MIEKFAGVRSLVLSEFLDLNHTRKSMIRVSLVISKFAPKPHRRAPANFEIGTLEPPWASQERRRKNSVPICRAAKGALALPGSGRPYSVMDKRHALRRQFIKLRAQRWSREALLALLLTVAAAVFIATAMLGKNPLNQDPPTVETASPPRG
jgi:hypothetical protein